MGLIIHRYCECGNYAPVSTKGVINSDCRNCGGKKRPLIAGGRRFGRRRR